MSRRRSQIWILLLSNSGRRALWDGFRKWENERESINCVWMWMCVHEPLVCGKFDKRAAGQCWQVKPVRYTVTSLSERVIARWPGHLKIREAISPTLNCLSFSVYHPYFLSSVTPSRSFQIHLIPSKCLPLCPNPFSSNSFSASFIHFSFQILTIPPSLFATSFSIYRLGARRCFSGVSLITCGFTLMAMAKNRGTEAITHLTTHCLLCYIKGEWVIFQLQFTVSCLQLERSVELSGAYLCVHGSIVGLCAQIY